MKKNTSIVVIFSLSCATFFSNTLSCTQKPETNKIISEAKKETKETIEATNEILTEKTNEAKVAIEEKAKETKVAIEEKAKETKVAIEEKAKEAEESIESTKEVLDQKAKQAEIAKAEKAKEFQKDAKDLLVAEKEQVKVASGNVQKNSDRSKARFAIKVTTCRVLAKSVNIRSKPSTASKVVGQLKVNARARGSLHSRNWLKLTTSGYVAAKAGKRNLMQCKSEAFARK